MRHSFKVSLIDHDARRRASISHALSAGQVHVEPFETVDELAIACPRSTSVMVYDDGGSVEKLVKVMTQQGRWHGIIAFCENPRPRQIVEAILAGARDYIAWPFVTEELDAALARIAEMLREPNENKSRAVIAQSQLNRLTQRELEVLDAVSRGLANRLIAEKLAISRRTVEAHRASILAKLGTKSTPEAVRLAVEAALAPDL